MSSLRRIRASRANGRRSRGPVTPQGKQRSSFNAVRHGLLAQSVVLPGESEESFLELVRQFIERFRPIDDFECNLVEEMAAHYWRMRRAWTVETNTLTAQIELQSGDTGARSIAIAFATLATDPTLALAHRCEARFHRMYQRALQSFLFLRSKNENPANEPNPGNEHSDLSRGPSQSTDPQGFPSNPPAAPSVPGSSLDHAPLSGTGS
jgi:hypothetical protein